MTTTKLKRYRTKQLAKSKLVNRLVTLSLILIMVLISIPKMALAQLFDDSEQQKVSGVPNASIKLPNTEYTESTVDLRVKVLGGEVKLNRTWVNGRWYINPAWSNLRFVLDPLDNSVRTIDRAGTLYQRTGDANLYSNNQVYIKKTTNGWQWYDRQGNWINYDNDGRLIEYGDRNKVKVTFVLDSEGRRTAIKDHHGELVYNFSYDANERLTQVEDREGRTVSYQWTGDRLTKVTDVLGYEWLYGYDNNGQLNQKTEPDGGIIKIAYTDSVPAPKTAMNSGKDKQQSESSVVSTAAKDKDTKLARVGKITDKTGAVTVYNSSYNRTNKQYTITVDDPVGKKTVKVFDSKGKKLSTTINNVMWESYERDEKNYLVKVKDQRGLTTITQYNQSNHPIKITYPNGSIEIYNYNNNSNLIQFTNREGISTTWDYDAKGNLIKRVEAEGKSEQRVMQWSYDGFGQPIKSTIGEGSSAVNIYQSYDRYGNIDSFTDGNGNKYQYEYNIQGQMTKITNPLNQYWKINYNKAGYAVKVINPLNNVTQYTTDVMGRIVTTTDALNNKTHYNYDLTPEGLKVSEINAIDETTVYYYDKLGRFMKSISPSGLVREKSYNKDGFLDKEIDYAGNQLTYKYGMKGSGLDGLLIETLYPTYSESYKYNTLGFLSEIDQKIGDNKNLITSLSYNNLGNTIATIDPANRTSQIEYDAFGNQIKLIDAMGQITEQTWDILNNRTSVTDANGNIFTFEYDSNGNLIKETKALGNVVEYTYDKANQLIQQRDASGNIINYQYDNAGYMIKETFTKEGQTGIIQTVTYSYNNVGQLIEVNQTGDTNSNFIYHLDALGRKVNEIITYNRDDKKIINQLQFTYDSDGNLASLTYPDNTTVQYSYKSGKLAEALLDNSEKIIWNKYEWYSPTEIIFPNSLKSYSYDALRRPLTIKALVNKRMLMDRQYTYDKVGNITRINTEDGEKVYEYDLLDRLKLVIPAQKLQQLGFPVESYSYDAIGNRVGSSQQSGEWQYNDKNQLVKWGVNSNEVQLMYTKSGHQEKEISNNKELTYYYNAVDRLVSVKNSEIEIAHYQYDAFGRRISKVVNGITTYYIYTNEGLLAELDEQGKMRVAYGWEPNTAWGTTPLWQANLLLGESLTNAQYNYIHTNHLGTPQLAIDSLGQQTWKGISDAFGNLAPDTNSKIVMNLRFPGQYYDEETGLHYNYSRDYNPKIGRYIQSDPIGIEGGLNTFSYTLQNPIKYIDNLGLQTPSGCFSSPGMFATCVNEGLVAGPKPIPVPLPPPSIINCETDRYGVPIGKDADALSDAHANTSEGYGGNCEPNDFKERSKNKEANCSYASQLGRCTEHMSEAQINIRSIAFAMCARAREKVAECFDGGDSGHRQQINQNWESSKNCNLLRKPK